MENKNIVLGWWSFLIVVSVFNIAFITNYYFTHSYALENNLNNLEEHNLANFNTSCDIDCHNVTRVLRIS